MARNNEKDEMVPVDWTRLDDEPDGDQITQNAEEANDAWGFGDPPPAGEYDLKIHLVNKKDAVTRDPNTGDYLLNLQCNVVAPGNKDADDAITFAMVSTKIGRGKGISTLGALIVKMGGELPQTITRKGMLRLFYKLLVQEPLIRGNTLDWTGYAKTANKGEGRQIISSYVDWPKDGEGKPIVPYKFSETRGAPPEEVKPQLRIKEWGSVKGKVIKQAAQVEQMSSLPVIDDTIEEDDEDVKMMTEGAGK